MENYTKYKLKDREELTSLLADKDNLFLIACNKCFKEFETVEEPECAELEELARELGKTVTGSARVDFLCNKVQTEKKLQDMIPEGTEHILVASCGLGIQTVADLTGKKVYAASNSLNYRGYHGMALTERKCDACAQCYLNVTGGICPIVDCSKSLVNGQCGGAKDGKCEVDSQQGLRLGADLPAGWPSRAGWRSSGEQPVQLRDYSKVNPQFVRDYVEAVRANRLDGYYGGVHPTERKEFTEHLPLQRFPEPAEVVIPLSMHAGSPGRSGGAGRRHREGGPEDRRGGGLYQRPRPLQRQRHGGRH